MLRSGGCPSTPTSLRQMGIVERLSRITLTLQRFPLTRDATDRQAHACNIARRTFLLWRYNDSAESEDPHELIVNALKYPSVGYCLNYR